MEFDFSFKPSPIVKEVLLPVKVEGLECNALLDEVVETRWSGHRKVETSGSFSGTHLLKDGRVIQEDVQFGWYRTGFVFESTDAWRGYKHPSAHDINPALKFY